jgi:hypothetical protein
MAPPLNNNGQKPLLIKIRNALDKVAIAQRQYELTLTRLHEEMEAKMAESKKINIAGFSVSAPTSIDFGKCIAGFALGVACSPLTMRLVRKVRF